MTDHM